MLVGRIPKSEVAEKVHCGGAGRPAAAFIEETKSVGLSGETTTVPAWAQTTTARLKSVTYALKPPSATLRKYPLKLNAPPFPHVRHAFAMTPGCITAVDFGPSGMRIVRNNRTTRS